MSILKDYSEDHNEVVPFDRDKLNLVARDRAASAAQQAMTALHLLPAHEQMAGIAVLFAVYTRRFGLDPEDTYWLGIKLVRPERYHHKGNSQIEALDDLSKLHKEGNYAP